MGDNKRESIKRLHMQNILSAAEMLFTEKGYENTTIDDISKLSEYSRRTVYAYFTSKEEIYYHIILKGLKELKVNLSEAVSKSADFMVQYKAICNSMVEYFNTSPHSFTAVDSFQSKNLDLNNIPAVVTEIFVAGEEINKIIEQFLEGGKLQKAVKANVKVKETVLILWTSISGILSLVKNKGSFIEQATGASIQDFLDYSFSQIINSILEGKG